MKRRRGGGIALLAVVLVALALAEWLAAPRTLAQSESGLVAYLQDGDISLIRLETAERAQLTQGGVVDWFAWSPRGTEVVLSTRNPDGSAGGLFVQALDGSAPRRIDTAARDRILGRRVAWAPDGNQLAFADDDAVLVVNAQGTEARRYSVRFGPSGLADLGAQGVSLGTPAYYPDGGRLLVPLATRFEIGAGGNTRIRFYAMNLGDGTLTPVASDVPALGGRLPQNTAFAPDGRSFGYTSTAYVSACEQYGFFARLDPAASSLQLVDAQAGPPPTLRISNQAQAVGTPGWGLYPRGFSWAPDGRRVALSFAYRECAQGADSPAPAQLFVVPSEGQVLALGRATSPAWAPRGELLAYVTDEAPRTVRVRDLAANTERNLGPGDLPAWQPQPAR